MLPLSSLWEFWAMLAMVGFAPFAHPAIDMSERPISIDQGMRVQVVARHLETGGIEFGLFARSRLHLPAERRLGEVVNSSYWRATRPVDLGHGYAAQALARRSPDGRYELAVRVAGIQHDFVPNIRTMPDDLSNHDWHVTSTVVLSRPQATVSAQPQFDVKPLDPWTYKPHGSDIDVEVQMARIDRTDRDGELQSALLTYREGAGPQDLVINLAGNPGNPFAFRHGLGAALGGYLIDGQIRITAVLTPYEDDWNGTDACCFFKSPDYERLPSRDDVAWLSDVVAQVQTRIEVDRIFVVGFHAGGFMAYRLACDANFPITAIVVFNGSSFADPARCDHAPPVSILHLHGTGNLGIRYAGESGGWFHPQDYPAASDVVRRWATRAGCQAEPERPEAGYELLRWETGCADDVTIELHSYPWKADWGPTDPEHGRWIAAWMNDRVLPAERDVMPTLDPAPARIQDRLEWSTPFAERHRRHIVAVADPGQGEPRAWLVLPADYRAETGPLPVVFYVHGHPSGAWGGIEESGLMRHVVDAGFALLLPNAPYLRRCETCPRYWQIWEQDQTDVTYLSSLVEGAREFANLDGVYLIGYSGGGFMAHHAACLGMSGLSGIVSIAGASTHQDASDCEEAGPISVLHMVGMADERVSWDGGTGYIDAEEILSRRLTEAGCSQTGETLPSFELLVEGEPYETTVTRYREHCAEDTQIEVWQVLDGPHHLYTQAGGINRIVDWIMADYERRFRS